MIVVLLLQPHLQLFDHHLRHRIREVQRRKLWHRCGVPTLEPREAGSLSEEPEAQLYGMFCVSERTSAGLERQLRA
jgi:hypothetical protein